MKTNTTWIEITLDKKIIDAIKTYLASGNSEKSHCLSPICRYLV